MQDQGRFADSDRRIRLDSLFRRPSAASNSVNPGLFSKWRPAKDVKYRRRTRFQISASEAFANSRNIDFCGNFVTLFRDAFSWHTFVTVITSPQSAETYSPSHSTRARTHTGEFTMAASRPGTRPSPGCARYNRPTFHFTNRFSPLVYLHCQQLMWTSIVTYDEKNTVCSAILPITINKNYIFTLYSTLQANIPSTKTEILIRSANRSSWN